MLYAVMEAMFEDYFYLLRDAGIPVSITEWMTLQDALDGGLMANPCWTSTTLQDRSS